MKSRRRVGILVFDGITALDLAGPADAFASAQRGSAEAPEPAYEVVVLGISTRACVAESGVKLTPDRSLRHAPALDTLIIPGGSGLREPKTNRAVASFIERARQARAAHRGGVHRHLRFGTDRVAGRPARHDALGIRG